MGLLTGPNSLGKKRRYNSLLAQALRDNAPVGSVGAPGGLLMAPAPEKPRNALSGLLAASSVVPGIGDFTGPMADAHMYATDPSSRTPGNFALSAAGLLPFVPSVGAIIREVPAPSWLREQGIKTIPVGEDPTNADWRDLFEEAADYAKRHTPIGKKAADADVLRTIEAEGKFYAWPASMALHQNIADAMKISPRSRQERGMVFREDILGR